MLNGAIPPCALASPTLKQLELTDNYLDGTIPDLPPNSPLVVLDLSNNGAGAEEGPLGVTRWCWCCEYMGLNRSNCKQMGCE